MTESPGFGDHMRRLVRHTAVYGLGFAATSALMLLLTPLYTHLIAPADYGKLRLVSVTLEILAIVGRLGVIEAFFRFFFQSSERGDKGKILGACLMTMTLPLVLLGAATALFSESLAGWILDSPGDGGYFLIAAGTLVASGLSTFGLAYLRVEERSGLYAAASLGQLSASLGLNILLLAVFDLGVAGVLAASLVSQTALALALLPLVLRGTRPSVDIGSVRQVLRFGLPLIPAGIAGYLISQVSIYFLNGFATLDQVGIYSLALQFGAAINILVVMPFDLTWAPMKYKLATDPQANRIYASVLSYYVVVALFVLLGLACLIGDVMAIVIDARYAGAALYVGGIGLGYAVYGASRVFSFGIEIKNKTSYRALIIMASFVLSVLVNALAVPRIGAWGAIAGLLSAYVFMAVSAYIVSQRLFPVPYQLGRILKASVIAAVHAAVALSIETGSPWANLAFKLVIVVSYPASLYLFRFCDDAERAALGRLAQRLRRAVGGGRGLPPSSGSV